MMQHDSLLNFEKEVLGLFLVKNATVTRPVIMPLAILPQGDRQVNTESKVARKGEVLFWVKEN